MPSQITNYKCPNCRAPIHFDADTQNLKCDNCGSTFPVAEIEEKYAEANAIAVEASENYEPSDTLQFSEDEKLHLRAYSCPSCGAQLIYEETTVASSCPYCNNTAIVPAQIEGALKPDFIVPFKLKKEEAVKKLAAYYKGKPFLPTAFTKNNHIEEIKGVYVPFWLYDGEADADISYMATRSHSHMEGDYQVTKTDYFQVNRAGSVAFEMVPADASSKMDDALMDSLEPYDYSEMVPFEISYLPGYLADKYDVSVVDNQNRVEVRMRNSAKNEIDLSVGNYDSLTTERSHIDIIPDRVHYAFLPIWYLTTKWKDKYFVFAMNGQTGKFIGDLPVDMGKFWMTFIGITIVGIAILYLLFMR